MEEYARELMRRVVRPDTYAPVIAKGVDDIWAMDLADFQDWHERNDGYKYVLVVVDVLTRFAWCKPLKSKNAKEVWEALQSVIDENKKPPSRIWVDRGTEFYNGLWTSKLKALGVPRYSTYGDYKVSIAERFIRTLKHRIWFIFLKDNTRRWIDVLDGVVKDYNNTVHSTLGMTPRAARTQEDELLGRVKTPPVATPKYKLGDWVRINRLKGIFEKGFHPNWSYEIFKIVGIRKSVPVLYELVDFYGDAIEGAFYESDIQPVADPTFFPVEKVLKQRTLKGKREKLVKLLGYKEPRWLPADDVEGL